jgi:hypothetical protein
MEEKVTMQIWHLTPTAARWKYNFVAWASGRLCPFTQLASEIDQSVTHKATISITDEI